MLSYIVDYYSILYYLIVYHIVEWHRPYLTQPDPLEQPENLPSMTHGMKDRKPHKFPVWGLGFRVYRV